VLRAGLAAAAVAVALLAPVALDLPYLGTLALVAALTAAAAVAARTSVPAAGSPSASVSCWRPGPWPSGRPRWPSSPLAVTAAALAVRAGT
jgi:hypothetical protein